ncbi:MAG: ABC transporter permease [Bacteroidales bacterium]|jgi:ABC-2 type transport system permease protein|nr:ABC transporter permease [Bacteroidales bacterium]
MKQILLTYVHNISNAVTAFLLPERAYNEKAEPPLWVMVSKEITDIVHSWRFLILFALIIMTAVGSVIAFELQYSEITRDIKIDDKIFFLRIFTWKNSIFLMVMQYLCPVLGICLGFDAINSEQTKGTLSRVLSQPVYRDYILLSKFLAALLVVSLLFTVLMMIMFAWGLLSLGVGPTLDEFLRLLWYLFLTIVYVAFWLNIALFFSGIFRQSSASVLTCISAWLIFSVLAALPFEISSSFSLNPIFAYQQAIMILMTPELEGLLKVPIEYAGGVRPTLLPLNQNIIIAGGFITYLIAGSVALFAMSYYFFMRREIRSR